MIKKLEKLGDRMLGKVVRKVEASAMICGPIWCGCRAGFESYKACESCSCGKCQGIAC